MQSIATNQDEEHKEEEDLARSMKKKAYEKLIKDFVPKLKFGFSVMSVSSHSFLTFIDQNYCRDPKYVLDKLDFNDIRWENLVKKSREEGLNMKQAVTDGGKPLLQVCIDNEHIDGSWQLKQLMKLLLAEGVDPNVSDFEEQYRMLSYSLMNKKHQAFEMLVKHNQEDN